MSATIKTAADTIIDYTVDRAGGAPGVVAMATDRDDNFYEGAAGKRELGQDAPMTTDTVMSIFSCTKALAGVTVMQLVEEGEIKLADPVKAYVPEIADIQVLDGFDGDGNPRLRAPKSDITVEQLMLHTAGFSYEFFNQDDLDYRKAKGVPSVTSATFESIRTVLHHDPGARWTYGVNMDWAGKVVEAVRGQRLGDVMAERVFAPLDMHDIGFVMTPSMQSRLATIHTRAGDGKLTPAPDNVLPQPPEMDMAGQGLFATIGEYMKFIRMMLNDGAGPNGRVLKAETVQRMAQNGLGALKSGGWISSIPAAANHGEFFPGVPKSWGYTFQINDEPTPTGRPAGQLMWAGLANLFYWIDRQTGVGGMWGSQILPFQDIASYPGFVDFETAVYRYGPL